MSTRHTWLFRQVLSILFVVLPANCLLAATSNWVVPNGEFGPRKNGTYLSELNKTHVGVDIIAPHGSEVYAFDDGVAVEVIKQGDPKICEKKPSEVAQEERMFCWAGNAVMIMHPTKPRKTYTIYLHLAEKPLVSPGQEVEKGKTLIGRVGHTGAANVGQTGGAKVDHVHFEIRYFREWLGPGGNIYLQGDQSKSEVLKTNWDDPLRWFSSGAAMALTEAEGTKSKEGGPSSIEKPEFFGVYVVLKNGKSVPLKSTSEYEELVVSRTNFQDPAYRYLSSISPAVTNIDKADMTGVIVYLDKISVDSVRINAFATVREFRSCAQPDVFRLEGEFPRRILEFDRSEDKSWLDTKFGLGPEALNIKRLGEDMYYLEPKKDKANLNSGEFSYEPFNCNTRNKTPLLGVVINPSMANPKLTWYLFAPLDFNIAEHSKKKSIEEAERKLAAERASQAQAECQKQSAGKQRQTIESGAKMMLGLDGASMVLVPAGEFTMGSNDGDADEKPERRVTLDAFYMDKYEVSTRLYSAFLQATNCEQPDGWSQQVALVGSADRPVAEVTWQDADTYCRYYGKRLPTEQEWEKAARGTDGRKYPWGNEEPTSRHALFNQTWNGYGTLGVVGSHEAGGSPYGIQDLAGNVSEWTSSDTDSKGKAGMSPLLKEEVVRGGSWIDGPVRLRSADRSRNRLTARHAYLGFRCALDARP